MGEWLKKNGSKLVGGGIVAAWFAAVGTLISTTIRGDKRQIKYYQKATEIQDEQLAYWRDLNKKES